MQFSSSAHKRVKRVLTEKQIAIVREEALEAFPAAALLLDTGMRRGELLGTMWTDFVLEPGNGSLHIQRTVVSEVGVLKLAAPKKNSFRTIPISDECIAWCSRCRTTACTFFLRRPAACRIPTTFLSGSRSL